MKDDKDRVELQDIENFVNLKPLQKKEWIVEHPDRTLWMLDYLINITKDRDLKDCASAYLDGFNQSKDEITIGFNKMIREVIPDIPKDIKMR